MPSIELICVGQVAPVTLPTLPFAIRAEPDLISHRSPTPRFQPDFNPLQGWIYHLENLSCNEPGYEGAFFGYDLLSEACLNEPFSRFLEFTPEAAEGLKQLIDLLLASSPTGHLLFTTDWQFGPLATRRFSEISVETFWERHARRKLRLNALYPIRKKITSPRPTLPPAS